MRKARIWALLKSCGLLEARNRKGLTSTTHPSVPAPRQGRGNCKPHTLQRCSRCSGWGPAEDNKAFLQARHRILGGRGGEDQLRQGQSPAHPGLPAPGGGALHSGLTGVDKKWFWGQQCGEGPLLPLFHFGLGFGFGPQSHRSGLWEPVGQGGCGSDHPALG